MGFRDFLPFQQAPARRPKASRTAQILAPEDQAALVKVFKVAGLALGFQGGGGGTSRASFEAPRYDLARILEAVDTDSYIKQGLNKYRELMWKEGWRVVGENPETVDYVYTRFDFMELVMRRPIQDLFAEIGDQLIKFGNCFVVKARGDITQFFPLPLEGSVNSGKTVVGYYILPAETVEIARDENNKVIRYRQNVAGGGGGGNPPEFKPEEVIHFSFDKKPGRAFGTPFLIAVIDDIVALRQVEEDVQNLVHRELFPLYTYKVGTPENPAQPEEITAAAQELSNLRTEGGLVIPERHEVDVIGGQNKALDVTDYLKHFKERVTVGLGLSGHHLGMTDEGGNRAVTDRLDIALYDKVKMYQRYLEDMIRLHVLNELLLEGGYDPLVNPLDPSSVSDRCLFRFNEIDTDTQIKKEEHILQLMTGNAITLPEARLRLGDLDPEVEESELFIAVQSRMTPDVTTQQQTATGDKKPVTIDTTPQVAKKSDTAAPSQGGVANRPNAAAKQIGNKTRPANQHGRRRSPNVRHSLDEEWLDEVVELIDDDMYKEL